MKPEFVYRLLQRAAPMILLLLGAAVLPAVAQTAFPSKPIRMVIGYGAGGGSDILGRLVGAKLAEILGQSVIIENRPGASGRLAGEYVSNQPADGYTLYASPIGPMSVAAAVYPDLKYDPVRSFVPLAMVGEFPLIMVVRPDIPASTVEELIAFAKQHPDKANYPSTSPSFTIPMEELKLASGMPGVTIPYKSSEEMVLSVIEQQSMMSMVDPPPAMPQIAAGKLKALAVTGNERLSELPNVPSMAEAGYPSVDMKIWVGVFAPAGTPPAIAAKLENALHDAIHAPSVVATLHSMAINPSDDTPEQFKQHMESDVVKFREVVKRAHLKFGE